MDGLEQPHKTDWELYETGRHRDLNNYLTKTMGLPVQAGRGPVWYRAQALIEKFFIKKWFKQPILSISPLIPFLTPHPP